MEEQELADIQGLFDNSIDNGIIDYSILQNPNFSYVFGAYEKAKKGEFASMDYVPVRTSDNSFRIMIGSNSNEYLYRGERDCRFELIPGIKRLSGIDKAIAWIKTDMFKECIKSSCYMDLNQMKIDELHFDLDLEAIAQHYGFYTNYLDFTKDKKVAEFFAYTKFEDGVYKPITDFEVNPKIYRVKIHNFVRNNPKSFKIVGFQCAERADAQKALALDFSEEINTEGIETIILEKDPKKAKEVFEYFDGGNKLFPKDLLTTISNNFSKLCEKDLYIGSVIKYARKDHIDFCKLRCDLQKLGYKITDNILKPDEKDNESISEDVIKWKKLIKHKSLINRKHDMGSGLILISGRIDNKDGRAYIFDFGQK